MESCQVRKTCSSLIGRRDGAHIVEPGSMGSARTEYSTVARFR